MTRQFFARMAAAVMIVAAGLLGTVATAQNRAISGTVVDESGAPVVGAAVVVVGNTSIGAVTDVNGAFRLNVPAGANINVSCIGYADQTVAVGNQTTFRFVLVEDTEFLDETVVIGYGIQKKSDLTGAVASVREADLKNRSTGDAAAALQGKAAGVQVLSYSGAPGQQSSIRVRGYSSNSGSIGPLLIVDGLKVDNITYLDPTMIESIEILKDAASAAIYGAQAGNGVVLITTKSGQEGSTSITYDYKLTRQNLAHLPGVMNRAQFIDFKKMQGYNIDAELTANGDDGVIDTDWSKELFETGLMQQHALSFQGGNRNGHFFVSLNYLDNNGIVVGDKDVYKRLSTQINADYKIKPWLTVGTNNSIEKWSTRGVNQRSETNSPMMAVIQNDPLTPAYYDDPSQFSVPMTTVWNGQVPTGFETYDPHSLILQAPDGRWYAVSKYVDNDHGSPLIQLARSNSTNSGVTLRGSLFANFNPFKGFVFTSRFGYRLNFQNSHNWSEPYYANDMAKSDQYSISAGANTGIYYQWENFANYSFAIGKNEFTAMAGMSFTERTWDNVSASANGKADFLPEYYENFRYLDKVQSGENTTKSFGNNPDREANLSYFGRLVWSYDNRYSVQANFRADAFDSSKLPKESRWGFFPSVSAGWTLSNESFIKNNVSRDILSFLKLRASWGINGNISVLNGFRYATTVSPGGVWYEYGLGGQPSYGTQPSGIANPDLKWETSVQTDFGLDARFLNNRLSLGIDWYNKDTRDLLVSANLTPEIGVSSSTINSGSVNNRGLEFELGWKDTIGDFSYGINANFATLKNKVTYLDPSIPRDVHGSYYVSQIRSAFEVGYPIWYMYGYQYDGYKPETGEPILHDFTGEGEVNDDDKTFIGSGIPDYTYGITLNMAWKGFDFVVFGTGVGGNEIFPVLYRTDRPYNNTLEYYHANAWTESNKNAKLPNMALVANDTKFWASSANVFDGSYFKIKQIQLGYTLPARITKKVLVDSLRMFVSLDDFFTFTSYPGLDPETATTENADQMGFDLGTYPTTRKVVFGVNVSF